MPKGVDVIVENGLATIDFVDKATRNAGLAALLANTPAELVEKLTRSGPRATYRVPEGNARAAGLLDTPVVALQTGDTGHAAALAAADPNDGSTHWHNPQITVAGHAHVAGRDGVNAHIQGPLRPNKPVAESVPGVPVSAVSAGPGLAAWVESKVPRPADYAPRPTEHPVPGEMATIASVVNAPSPKKVSKPKTQATADAPAEPQEGKPYPDGEPSDKWKRPELDAYAWAKKRLDTSELPSKTAVLEAIANAG
jgi:hypothetical protein